MKPYSKYLVFILTLTLLGCGPGGDDEGVVGTGFTLHGSAVKGPYLSGSQVLLSRLLNDGTPSPETTRTEIEDDLGSFRYALAQEGAVLFSADGLHYNEITGKPSNGRLMLNALYVVTKESQQYTVINVLTHIAYKRALRMVRQGWAPSDAIKKAEFETLTALTPIVPTSAPFDFSNLNLYDFDKNQSLGNAYVLALSSIITQYAMDQIKKEKYKDESFDSYLTFMLGGFADDLAQDGVLDILNDQQVVAEFKKAMQELRPDQIKKNLENRGLEVRNEKLTVANMDYFIDTDGDGIVNIDDTDIDNDGILNDLDVSPYAYSTPPTLSKPLSTSVFPTKTPVTLEWTPSDPSKEFEIVISKNEDFTNPVVATNVATNTYTTSFDYAGRYFLKIRAKNELDAWGPWSTPSTINISIFDISIAGYNSPVVKKMINTIDGSVVALAKNRSSFILYSIDATGAIQWQYSLGTNTSQFEDVIELSDGKFVLVGQTGSYPTIKGKLVVLDTLQNTILDKTYSDPSHSMTKFKKIVPHKDNAVLIADYYDCDSALPLPNCAFSTSSVETVGIVSGEFTRILTSLDISDLSSPIQSVTETSSQKLLITYVAAKAYCPPDVNPLSIACDGYGAGMGLIADSGIVEWKSTSVPVSIFNLLYATEIQPEGYALSIIRGAGSYLLILDKNHQYLLDSNQQYINLNPFEDIVTSLESERAAFSRSQYIALSAKGRILRIFSSILSDGEIQVVATNNQGKSVVIRRFPNERQSDGTFSSQFANAITVTNDGGVIAAMTTSDKLRFVKISDPDIP